MQCQLIERALDGHLTEYNKLKEFERYSFNYNKKMHWGNPQQHTYYGGSQVTNPKNKIWLQVLEKDDETQFVKKSLEKELKNLNCLKPNQHIQIILETQVQAFDQNLQKRIWKPCLILKMSLEESQQSKENPQNKIILLEKYQINLKDKFAQSILGDIYQGFQISQPMKKILVQILSKPYKLVTSEEVEQVIDDVAIIIKNWNFRYFDGGKANISNQSLNAWKKKYYLILESIQESFDTCNDDVEHIQSIIKENGIIKISNGNYQFSSNGLFARGGQGHVYLGYQTSNPNNKVAIKVISSRFQDFSEKKTKRLIKELNIMKHLDPSCAVKLLNEGQVQVVDHDYIQKKTTKLKYFVMELMDGSLEKLYQEVLKPRLKQNKKEGMKLVKQYFFWILWVYRACYKNNVAHTDLKPQNILIKKNQKGEYQIKIADFGISTHQTSSKIKDSVGTKAYCSPQQHINTFYTYKCDIFALGGIFIYLILGSDPLTLKIVFKQKEKVDKKKLYDLLKDYDEQDRPICKYIQKCLSVEEENRYQYDEILKNEIFEKYQNASQSRLILNELAETLRKKGTFDKALKYCKQCLEIQKKIKGEGSIDTALTLNNIGLVYSDLGDYKNALKFYEQCLEIQKKIIGEGSVDTASTLGNIAQVYKDLGDYKNALKLHEQCLEIIKKIKGEGSINTVSTLNNIGSVYKDLGDYKNALKFYEQCLEIQKKIKGVGNIDTASTLNNIGNVNNLLGDYKNALKFYEQCLEIKKSIKGEGSIDTASTLNNIGSVYKDLGDYENALKFYEQCLEIQKKIKGEGNIDSASTLGNIALLYSDLGYYENALKFYKQCLEIQKKIKGEESIDTASTLSNIGIVYNHLGDYKNALKFYEQCLEIEKKIKGVGSIDTASTLNNIGNVHNLLGDYKNALKFYEQCLEIEKRIKGEKSIDTASTLGNIGSVYKDLEDYENALKFYEQCLEIQKKIKGEGNIDTALTLSNIGLVYSDLGDYKNALKLFGQCLEIQNRIKGEGSIDTALTLGNIGSVYKDLGDYENALKFYEQCLEIQKTIKGEGNIDYASTLGNIGVVHIQLSNYNNAIKNLQQSLIIFQRIFGKGNIKSENIQALIDFINQSK